jgi:O-antigen ligase
MNTLNSNKSRVAGPVLAFNSPVVNMGAALVLALGCFLVWSVAASSPSLAIAAVAVVALIPAVMIGCSLFGARPVAVFGLIYSVPFSLMHHLIYRPNVGAADGLTIQLIDLWIIWLVIHYAYQRRHGTIKPIHGFSMFCIPLALLLAADCLSLINSVDIQLSIYGILNHLRAAALFIVLALTLAQGKKELRAAYIAIVCAVSTIGGICIVEMMLQTNIRNSVSSLGSSSSAFRASGMDTPTIAAAYLAALIPIVAIEYFYPAGRSRKLLAALGLWIGLAGIGCTLTRAAIGIAVLGAIPLLVFLYRRRLILLRHTITCLLVFALLWLSLGAKLIARVDRSTATLNGRVPLMQTALNMASDSPFVGVGINTYELRIYDFTPIDQRQKFEYVVHNKFLLTLAETGVLGFASFVSLCAIVLRRVFVLARSGLPMGMGLLCSMIILVLDMNVEIYEAGSALLNAWILMAILAALWSEYWASTRRCSCEPANKWPNPAHRQEII